VDAVWRNGKYPKTRTLRLAQGVRERCGAA
jgi:hypothetical protein